ncbi:MAG: 16S rRNA (adenine(1518)-N(6)/adenine(1519)-N(6))-dimethyltransferase RsmA [Bacteroidota bacterium]
MQYTLKKSLGQHFLHDENICRKIAECIEIEKAEQLLEVGPGAGALTKYLMKFPNTNFKAVELDDEKVVYLTETYPDIKGKIIHEDFLKVEPPFEGSFMVVGNFPYNISSQILFKVVEWKAQVPVLVGMFQKEVAKRIAAVPGNKDYGILSVLTSAFYDTEYLFDVSPGSFNPPPKVMSGVIKMRVRKDVPEMKSETHFRLLVKTAFNQRRKMLRNAVKPMFDAAFLEDEIFNKRAEQLTIDQFAALTFKMLQK